MKRISYTSRVVGNLISRISDRGFNLSRRLSGIQSKSADIEAHKLRLLGENPVVVDVGANIGQFAQSIFDLRAGARMLSIDPIPQNVEACRRRFADRKEYQVVQAAIGETSGGDVSFHVLPANQASSLMPPSDVAKQAFRSLGAAGTTITVPMRSLDDVVGEIQGFEQIDILKLDVEGYESHVLRGAKRTMERSRSLLVECQVQAMNEGAELFDEVCYLARSSGFKFTQEMGTIRDLVGNLLMIDLLFERR